VNSNGQDTDDLDRMLAELRALWEAVAGIEPSRRSILRGKIAQAIDKLKKQVVHAIAHEESGRTSYPLFQGKLPHETKVIDDLPLVAREARFPAEPLLRLYDKDLADQARVSLPQACRFSDIDGFREHLARTLPFNAESTRRRAATYLTGRYFPCGIINKDLAHFAAASEARPWLGDVLFYLTCRVEKIVASVADEIVWPSLADGGVTRKRITDYAGSQAPSWSPNSVKDVGAAIVRTYERLGIGSTTKSRLNVASRLGDFPAFAYLLHLEFPEPGMFTFDRLIKGPLRRWLLWDQEWIVKQLYACEEAGLLAKISEIDRARQFTMKFTLDEAVGPIVSLIESGAHEAIGP
jgi:DNA repair protein RadC